MIEVMNTSFPDLSQSRGDNNLVINCWEKSSPLIKELERTVNFAERKCGDLMQQLSFYKEYYKKWSNTDRSNNTCQKKKTKKCCRQNLESGSSSENDFEKINQYFYKKIKSKINKMNHEIKEVNRKQCTKSTFVDSSNDVQIKSESRDKSEEEKFIETKGFENKTCKSEPLLEVSKKEFEPSCNVESLKKEVKVTEKQSVKSVPAKFKNSKKRDFGLNKRRFSSLQRYKIRSKSLPQGVRRKFGFGGFIEIFDPKMASEKNINIHPKSITSMKTESSHSRKSRRNESKSKIKLSERNKRFLCKINRNSPKSTRSLHYCLSKAKTEIRPHTQNPNNYFSKGIKSESTVVKNNEKITQERKAVSHNSFYHNLKETITGKDVVSSTKATTADEIIPKLENKHLENLTHLISKPNSLVPFIRNPIPFIPCSSTSKTFNLGLNVQQVLSLIKHKKHSVTLQAIIKNSIQTANSVTNKMEPRLNTLFISQTTTSHSQVTSALCPAREDSEESFSIITENLGCRSKCTLLKQLQTSRSQFSGVDKNKCLTEICDNSVENDTEIRKVERPEDVWVVEQPDTTSKECKKVRSRCTCFPSKHCMDYHKVLKQYTGWKLSGTKTESVLSENYLTYNPMSVRNSNYNKSKLYPIPSQANTDYNGEENDGKFELMKVHNDLLNLFRKYSSLQEQIGQKNLDDFEVNAELDAMESELAVREIEFKDILNFYNQLMLLKEKIKSLRVRNDNSSKQPTIQQPQYQRPKKDPFRPTPSMALTKVLRKVQGLQEKIKLINAP